MLQENASSLGTSEPPNIREQHHFSSQKVVDEGALKILETQCKQCPENVEDIEDALGTRRRISWYWIGRFLDQIVNKIN